MSSPAEILERALRVGSMCSTAEALVREALEALGPPKAGDWIPHTPGDPMPCDGNLLVEVRFERGLIDDGFPAKSWVWGRQEGGYSIVAWRPAREGV
jgi:hypothetical protein